MRLVLGLAVACLAPVPPAWAGAWTQPRGQGQAIVKYEAMRAGRGFDGDGAVRDLPAPRRDASLALFAEYGLTERLMLQLKVDGQRGSDAFVDYQGRGPVEIGLTWQAWRDDRTAVSLYAGHADNGDARNAGYAAPGVGERDWEGRVSVGRSLRPMAGRWAPDRSFVEVQAARRGRQGLPDETRLDLTAGAHFGQGWMALAQAYAGAADGGARWASGEVSIVRTRGAWSAQAGWRRTLFGRETAIAEGPVVAIWRRF